MLSKGFFVKKGMENWGRAGRGAVGSGVFFKTGEVLQVCMFMDIVW